MGTFRLVELFIHSTLLPCLLLVAGAYFILFANRKIESPCGLKFFGNLLAGLLCAAAFAIFSIGVNSLVSYNATMCPFTGMAKNAQHGGMNGMPMPPLESQGEMRGMPRAAGEKTR
jgi:hypothetical protein